ncbi:hypothetical protein Bbelb_418870 [Branchiostoma belcheri]|nr:hypothetical protein Bbelb_418870 [Branchiostoma belcheri]
MCGLPAPRTGGTTAELAVRPKFTRRVAPPGLNPHYGRGGDNRRSAKRWGHGKVWRTGKVCLWWREVREQGRGCVEGGTAHMEGRPAGLVMMGLAGQFQGNRGAAIVKSTGKGFHLTPRPYWSSHAAGRNGQCGYGIRSGTGLRAHVVSGHRGVT